MIRKIVCTVLSLAMLLSLFTVPVAATEGAQEMNEVGKSVELTATPKDGSVDLAWTINGVEASDMETLTYDIEKKSGEEAYTPVITNLTNSSSIEAQGLQNLTEYTFKLTVRKDSDILIESDEVKAVPRANPGTITGLKTLKDWESITVKWNLAEGVDFYRVYADNKAVEDVIIEDPSSGIGEYRVMDLTERVSYKIHVEGYKVVGDNEICIVKSGTSTNMPAQAMYVTFKVRKTQPYYTKNNYTSKTKKKYIGGYLKPGKTYVAQGFISGRLRLMMNDRIYYFPRISAKNISQKYTKSYNYTKEEAENVVNHKGMTSRCNYMAWVSLHTQHIYFFKRDAVDQPWELIKDCETTTGKASSATPTSERVIQKHTYKRGKLYYWSTLYNWVSFHSWKTSKNFGKPGSGGCIRMTKSNAKWVYNTLPYKKGVETKVWIY